MREPSKKRFAADLPAEDRSRTRSGFELDAIRSAPKRTLAVFDLDGTLTRRDTLLPFLYQLLGPYRFAVTMVRGSAHLLFGRHAAKTRVLQLALSGRETEVLDRIAQRYAHQVVANGLRDDLHEVLQAHQAAGHRTAVISASPELYVKPIGELLGVDEVQATKLVFDQWVYDGRIRGRNCRGFEKKIRLEALRQRFKPAEIWGYGDSSGDDELLSCCDRPHRV